MIESVADLYILDVTINGNTFSIAPKDVDITFIDSIYSIYPRASIVFKDNTGIFIESRMGTLGVEISFDIGFQDNTVTLPFVVNNFQVSEQGRKQYLNGVYEIDLIHSFFSDTTLNGFQSFDGAPSAIIEEVIKNGSFVKTYIEETKPIQEALYYNPGLNFKDFLEKVILPNSLSSKNEEEPYYCFIDGGNNFHFETYSNMLSRKASKKIQYIADNKNVDLLEKALDFLPFSLKYEKVQDAIKSNRFYVTKTDPPEFESISSQINDNIKKPFPVKANDFISSNFTVEGFASETAINQLKIKQNLSKKGKSLVDKIFVSILLDTSVYAGKMVSIEADYEGGNPSASYNGDYLVEGVQHSWDSETEKGYTKLILSKQNPSFAVDSTLETEVFK